MLLKKHKQSKDDSWLFSGVLILLVLLIFAIVGSMEQLPSDITHKIQVAGGERY